MTTTLFGRFELHVLSIEASFAQAVEVNGSDHDAIFVLSVGQTEVFDGERWTIEPLWSSDGGAIWQPSRTRRRDMFDPALGHVLVIGCDDGPAATGDGDFDDVVIRLRELDPDLDELTGWTPPNFTYDPKSFTPGSGQGGGDG
jgi:hypothetical protein